MLVLTRKAGESIVLGDNIRLIVASVSGNRVKICLDAPKDCAIRRGEICEEKNPAAADRSSPRATARIPAGAVAR
jgi:carbon storage regulator